METDSAASHGLSRCGSVVGLSLGVATSHPFSVRWNLDDATGRTLEVVSDGVVVPTPSMSMSSDHARLSVNLNCGDVFGTFDIVSIRGMGPVLHGYCSCKGGVSVYHCFSATTSWPVTVAVLLRHWVHFDEIACELRDISDGRLLAVWAENADHAKELMENGAAVLILDSQRGVPGASERLCREWYGSAVIFSSSVVWDRMFRFDVWSWGVRFAANSTKEAALSAAVLAGCRRLEVPKAGSALVIGITGASCSGKTTLAAALETELAGAGWVVVRVGGDRGLDAYFASDWISDERHGAGDWESPGALRHWTVREQLAKDIEWAEKEAAQERQNGAVVIIEGFRAFWDPLLTHSMHVRFELGIEKEKAFQRRSQRSSWKGLQPYFEKFIWPHHVKYSNSALATTPSVVSLCVSDCALPDQLAMEALNALRLVALPALATSAVELS